MLLGIGFVLLHDSEDDASNVLPIERLELRQEENKRTKFIN